MDTKKENNGLATENIFHNLPPIKNFGYFSLVALLLFASAIGYKMMKEEKTPPAKPLTNGNPYIIGGILPLSGDAASYGIPMKQMGDLAQKEINANGGIGGRPLQIIWEDGKCESEDALISAKKLLNLKKIDLLVGVCSDEFLASAPLAQANKIISMTPSATNEKISQLGKYVFRTCPSDALAGKVAAEYAYQKMGARTAIVIAEDKSYTTDLGVVFSDSFKQLGGAIDSVITFKTGTTNFDEYAKLVKEYNPDVVYILPQTSTPGILLTKSLKEADVKSKILTAEVLLIWDAFTEQGDILEGVTAIEALFDESRPKAEHALDLYRGEFEIEPAYPVFMAGMYDIMYLAKEAYEAVGDDPDKMSEYFHGLKNWNGAVGVINFDSNGDPVPAYSIKLITNHTALEIDTYPPNN